MTDSRLYKLKEELKSELITNILPYWMNNMPDEEHGGFYGRMTGTEKRMKDAEKGGILNARILWTFSSAYMLLKDPAYLKMASRAREYVLAHFFDDTNGGTYWSLTSEGKPADTKKQIYSQAFFIYALSEYHRATGDEECLTKAIDLFRLIEKHSFDKERNGYFEAYSHDWKLLDDLRLSAKDANEKKTMNTHLHILEAYTGLYRVWKSEELALQLKNLIVLFLDRIIDSGTHHLNLFFDEDWNCKSSIVSYGHDIEASWLLHEAAHVLGDPILLARVEAASLKIAQAAAEGIQPDGSIIYETDTSTGHTDKDRHWWPQAETIVGYLNAYALSKDESFLSKSLHCWTYIKDHLLDKAHGEWFWSIKADGTVNTADDKAGFWKCPYHNARACFEVINRV